MFNFGLKVVIGSIYGGWWLGFHDGWRGVLPAGWVSYFPAKFKHDSLVWEAK